MTLVTCWSLSAGKIDSELLAALQSLRRWLAEGFKTPSGVQTAVYTDAEMDSDYYFENWGAVTG